MKERPILFSGEMVRAILDGRKSQTRRVVKGMALSWLAPNMFSPAFTADPANGLSPYGYAGDRLWVRETWMPFAPLNDLPGGVGYRADLDECGQVPVTDAKHTVWRTPKDAWKPSIFMRREVCRLVLEITDVRVERLQELDARDAVQEGVEYESAYGHWPNDDYDAFCEHEERQAVNAYRTLWDSLNASRGYGWDANPWVWVIAFRRSPTPEPTP